MKTVDKEIVFSKHAIQRVHESKRFIDDAIRYFKQSQEVELSGGRGIYKFLKYGLKAIRQIKYFVYKDYLFTVNDTNPNKVIVVTFTKLTNKN